MWPVLFRGRCLRSFLHMLLLFASNDVGMQQPSPNTVLSEYCQPQGKKGPQTWFCGMSHLNFEECPLIFISNIFLLKFLDECQVLTQEMRRGTCSRLAEIMQKACSKTTSPTKYLMTSTEMVPCQRLLQIRCIELQEYLGAFIVASGIWDECSRKLNIFFMLLHAHM